MRRQMDRQIGRQIDRRVGRQIGITRHVVLTRTFLSRAIPFARAAMHICI